MARNLWSRGVWLQQVGEAPKLFASMGVKIMLDSWQHTMTFFGHCQWVAG
jgi:hypothetical protein